MLATMGYITPEVAGKFPGEFSPSLGVKFEAECRDRERPPGHDGDQRDVLPGRPHGQRLGRLGAIHGLPAARLRERAGRAGAGGLLYDPSRALGDYENGGVLGVPNGSTLPAGETKSRKRLAMMAIIGVFYHSLRMSGASFCEPGRGDVYTAYFEVKGDAWGGVPCRC
ncbi:unnamed protein product [Prorocentrum cordatum]|uniref:Uncharacterized protein n=1 Tax=Prorocentrum cordatum TaxID=2364126 RepID=A0ABN9VM54_9DINO|nr:unnamed protein product [Polarella glacialis]